MIGVLVCSLGVRGAVGICSVNVSSRYFCNAVSKTVGGKIKLTCFGMWIRLEQMSSITFSEMPVFSKLGRTDSETFNGRQINDRDHTTLFRSDETLGHSNHEILLTAKTENCSKTNTQNNNYLQPSYHIIYLQRTHPRIDHPPTTPMIYLSPPIKAMSWLRHRRRIHWNS